MKRNKSLLWWVLAVFPLVSSLAQTTGEAPPPPAEAAAPALSPGAAEVVRLAGVGSGDDAVMAYIQNATATFDLTADQILYLHDIGVSSPLITAMLNRDSSLRSQAPAYTYDQKLYPATAPPPANPAPVQAPPPESAPAPVAAPVTAPLTPPSEGPAPVYVSSPPAEVSYFYSNLSPYGTWVQLDGIGWCWQPRVVVINRSWRPYCDSGHWVYTDAGWFWQSDYSWGWAPFHYGRWQMHPRCGWVWMPDRVWGPAWVTWRSEGNYCGWAPLPPYADFDAHVGYRYHGAHVGINFDFGLHAGNFTFIAMNNFHQHDFAHYRLPPTEVNRIYNHTTVVNNYVVNNNVIVNQGIKVDRVEAATHTQFRKVAIRDVPAGSPALARQTGPAKGEMAVYRPQLQAPPKPVNMVAQKVDDRHPVIQHTPVVSARPERQPMARTTQPSSASGRPMPQAQPPGTYPRPAVDRAPVYPQPQPPPTLHKAGTPSSSSTPATRTVEQPKTAPSDRQQQNRPTSSGPNANPQYPVRSGPATPPESTRPQSSAQSPSQYYPKGYHQASETYSLPPANARPADSRGQSSVNQRPPSGSAPGNKNPDGSSKKNEQ